MTVIMPTLNWSDRIFGYRELYKKLQAQVVGESDAVANCANVSAVLYHELPRISWVGFYFKHSEELVLGPFQGDVAHSRVAKGRGVCGLVIRDNHDILIQEASSQHCVVEMRPGTHSALGIPVHYGKEIVAVLQLESTIINRFDEVDRSNVDQIARLLSTSCAWGSYISNFGSH